MWKYRGDFRPPFARVPGPGQESVWDYPRPPVLVDDSRRVQVMDGKRVIADVRGSYRILETASPPTFYLPRPAVDMGILEPVDLSSFCEWKGRARYWRLIHGEQAIAWSYPEPSDSFAEIRDCLSFYPGRVACFVDGRRVLGQSGGFYGGWITPEILGPFKGEPGTDHF